MNIKKNLCKQYVHISSCGVCRPRAVQRTVYRMNFKKKKKPDKNNKNPPSGSQIWAYSL